MTLNEQLKALCGLISDAEGTSCDAAINAATRELHRSVDAIYESGGELPGNMFDGLDAGARMVVAIGACIGLATVFGPGEG